MQQLEGPLTLTRIFDHAKELSEFVETIARKWNTESRQWGTNINIET